MVILAQDICLSVVVSPKFTCFWQENGEISMKIMYSCYEGGRLLSNFMNLFNTQTRRVPPENKAHMILAQNWCLEVEWESEARKA